MACLGLISASLAMPCGAPGTPDLGRPISAKVLNASDIASFTVSSTTGLASITRIANKVAYDVTAINNALTITVGLKSQDIIPGAYDVSITFKEFSGTRHLRSGAMPLATVSPIASAELVIAVDHGNGIIKVYGLGAPLVCTEVSGDSSASEYVTYTYGVEDWQVGTTIHLLSKEDYDALSTPVVVPKPNSEPNSEPKP